MPFGKKVSDQRALQERQAFRLLLAWSGDEARCEDNPLPLFAFFKCSIRGRFLSCWRTRAPMPFVAWPTYSASKFLPKRDRKRIHRKSQGALPSQPYKSGSHRVSRPGGASRAPIPTVISLSAPRACCRALVCTIIGRGPPCVDSRPRSTGRGVRTRKHAPTAGPRASHAVGDAGHVASAPRGDVRLSTALDAARMQLACLQVDVVPAQRYHSLARSPWR